MRELIIRCLQQPRARPRGDHELNPGLVLPAGAPLRPAAVLVPLVERSDGLRVLLTRRTEALRHHAGQISFPGGRVEPTDATPVDCALRETEEEVGLRREHVSVAGELDPYVTGTGFRISPVVGFVRPDFTLAIDGREVAEAFEVPLSFVLDPANHKRHSGHFRGQERQWWAMPYGEYYIWGATAGMLVNLYERVNGR
ncbi:MAG: CoA pyrophosphatase [Alphaproteobacteria bacterium]|nr:CoA pyrophosphatase [Alphaproteobacteria bacterium]